MNIFGITEYFKYVPVTKANRIPVVNVTIINDPNRPRILKIKNIDPISFF